MKLIAELLYYFYKAKVLLRGKGAGRKTMALSRGAFYARAWQDAADHLQASITSLGGGVFEVTKGTRQAYVYLNHSPLDDSATVAMTLNKGVVSKRLAAAGIPVPKYLEFGLGEFYLAKDFVQALSVSAVVKPAFGTGGGSGITSNVKNGVQLVRAVAWARAFCPKILVEEQIEGETYRLLYLDGELLDCLIRRAPTVTGNGTSTIRHLIAQENSDRIKSGINASPVILTADLDMKNTISAEGLSLSSVLRKGERVKIKTVVNENRSDDNETVISIVCPEVVALGRRVVEIMGTRLAGIDIITTDPSRSIEKTGGAVIEVNATPGFQYHYFKKDGPFPMADKILRKVLRG